MATVQPIVEDASAFVQREYSAAAKRALARKPVLFINNEWVPSTHGATLVFLCAVSKAASRVYQRAGFRPCGSLVEYTRE